MILTEAKRILKENGYIIESLVANRKKLLHMIEKAMATENKDVYDFFYETDMPDDCIVLKKSIFIRTSLTFKKLKDICDQCGYYVSNHKSDIWITPITPAEQTEYTTDLYHISLSPNLDKTGIRLRSRMQDDAYDVYENRIYLFAGGRGGLKKLIINTAEEHRCKPSDFYVYRVALPKGYEVYQDPTVYEAIYVTNAIPAKYVTKVDIQ